MNNLAEIPTQTPIEIALGVDENGMTTARKLYEFLELNPANFSHWCKRNIVENEFAEGNVDFIRFVFQDETPTGGKVERIDFKLTAHFAKKLSMKGSGARAEEAREYFTRLEEKIKQNAIDFSQLSPDLQMFSRIFNSVAQQQMEQKRQAEQIQRVEERQKVLSETFQKTSDNEDFKAWCSRCINKIADSRKFCHEHYVMSRYRDAWNESYARLSEKRACRLKQRVEAAKRRAKKKGASADQLSEITYLSVIADDKDLKPVYETVIKEMMIAYCVDGN